MIENQLERSDHDHLGKIITCTAMIDAEVAIWIVAEPRAEHVRAVSWLNDTSATDFWLLKIEGIRIGDSPPAPLLTLIVGRVKRARRLARSRRRSQSPRTSAAVSGLICWIGHATRRGCIAAFRPATTRG